MLEEKILKLLRAIHLALHALEDNDNSMKLEESKLSDGINIKKNGKTI